MMKHKMFSRIIALMLLVVMVCSCVACSVSDAGSQKPSTDVNADANADTEGNEQEDTQEEDNSEQGNPEDDNAGQNNPGQDENAGTDEGGNTGSDTEQGSGEDENTGNNEGGNAGDNSGDHVGERPSGSHPDDYYTESGFVVYDPENSRGLKTDRIGYGFGVASNGQPSSVMVELQKKFNSMSNCRVMGYDSKAQEKVIYLTFDCGYEYNNNTAKVLDILKEKDVPSAFFCLLTFYKKNPEVTKRMIDEGHILGNHSANHPSMPSLTRTEMAEEIFLVDKYLRDTYNYKSEYFRPPSGEYSENMLDLCGSIGYKVSFWSMAYKDWETNNQPSKEDAMDTLVSRLHPGAVILLHSVSDTNVAILGDFIDYARGQGYSFVSLDDYEW